MRNTFTSSQGSQSLNLLGHQLRVQNRISAKVPKPSNYIRYGWSSGKVPFSGMISLYLWACELKGQIICSQNRSRITVIGIPTQTGRKLNAKKRHWSQVISKYSWASSARFYGLGIIPFDLWLCPLGSVSTGMTLSRTLWVSHLCHGDLLP